MLDIPTRISLYGVRREDTTDSNEINYYNNRVREREREDTFIKYYDKSRQFCLNCFFFNFDKNNNKLSSLVNLIKRY